jgi:purine-binding chemotaxis protein CheW
MAEQDVLSQLVTFQLGKEKLRHQYHGCARDSQKFTTSDLFPNAPGYVEGIFNLRGEIVPIINLHKRFHIQKFEL